MPRENKTRLAILGLLSWRPMSGYDIKKLVEAGLSHFWSESYGQLFPTLNRLVSEGLAIRRSDGGTGQRRRYVYSITRKGRHRFRKWLREASDEPRARNEFLLKFFLSSRLPIDESIHLLENYRDQQIERLDDYIASERILSRAVDEGELPSELRELIPEERSHPADRDAMAHQSSIFLLTLKHGIGAVEARLAWCDEALQRLRAMHTRDRAPRKPSR